MRRNLLLETLSMPLDRRAFRNATALSAALLMFVPGATATAQDGNRLIQQTCVACHNEFTLQGGLNLQGFDAENPHLSPLIAEFSQFSLKCHS